MVAADSAEPANAQQPSTCQRVRSGWLSGKTSKSSGCPLAHCPHCDALRQALTQSVQHVAVSGCHRFARRLEAGTGGWQCRQAPRVLQVVQRLEPVFQLFAQRLDFFRIKSLHHDCRGAGRRAVPAGLPPNRYRRRPPGRGGRRPPLQHLRLCSSPPMAYQGRQTEGWQRDECAMERVQRMPREHRQSLWVSQLYTMAKASLGWRGMCGKSKRAL